MAWILLRPSNYKQVAPLVRTGGSRHTGLAALPHRNIHLLDGWAFFDRLGGEKREKDTAIPPGHRRILKKGRL